MKKVLIFDLMVINCCLRTDQNSWAWTLARKMLQENAVKMATKTN